MKNHIKKLIPDNEWCISRHGWEMEKQGLHESQFTLGNGFIGSRGVLEELPYDSLQGTYIAGVFDNIGSKVADLVNLPNPINFRVSVDGEKLDPHTMPFSFHERHLNMKHGILLRRTGYETVRGHKIDYQSVRFFSMCDKNIAVMRVYVTPVNKPCTIMVETGINTSTSNSGSFDEGKKRHFKIMDVDISESKIISYTAVKTLGSRIKVAYGETLHISIGDQRWYSNEEHLELHLKKNETAVLTKKFAIFSKDKSESFNIKSRTVRAVEQSILKGYGKLLKEHCEAWDKLWDTSDVVVKGNREIQEEMRFTVYHLLITGIDNCGKSSIGAKTLSGEGYRGHVFWDTEIFILPFFIFTNPAVARSLILYRINRLDKARQIGRSFKYRGAMFPWESACTGGEETPTWARNLDGSIIRVRTNEFEHHITADIAYALYQYYTATGDDAFMLQYGYELLFETARFWASRVKFSRTKKRFVIRHVIGPDEFHEDVNNNAYTNMLARWNMFIAYGMFMKMHNLYPAEHKRLMEKIGMKADEIIKWKKIIRKIYVNVRKDGIVEQFEGFFKKKKVKITDYDENSMPVIPASVPLKKIGDYQIIKQADIVMLMYLLTDAFDKKKKRRNYNFYEPLTAHKSSLSPSVHAIVLSELDRRQEAFDYSLISLRTDTKDLYRNTAAGIHAANLGGTWQVVIHGFAGMRIVKGTLSVNPRLPAQIKSLAFSAYWKGCLLDIIVRRASVKIKCRTEEPQGVGRQKKSCRRKGRGLKIKVFGKLHSILPGKILNVRKQI